MHDLVQTAVDVEENEYTGNGRKQESARRDRRHPFALVRITFDKFHVVWHVNAAVDKMRRIKQRADKSLKGLRWSLLKDRASLRPEAAADLDALIARMTTVRTARAWVYKEQLREILERKQINVVRDMLKHWCTCVMRSKVEPMKEVAAMVRRHLEAAQCARA